MKTFNKAVSIFFETKRVVFLSFSIGVALFLSFILIGVVGYDRGIGTDGAFYALSGYNLFHGYGFTYSDVPNTFTWPGLSILIGFLSLWMDDLQLAMHLILAISFATTVIPIYLAAEKFINEQAARIAVILFVFHGVMLRISARLMPESMTIMLMCWALYYAFRMNKKLNEDNSIDVSSCLMFGLMSGLAYLTKPESMLLFVSLSLYFIIRILFFKTKKQILKVSAALLVFGATISPQLFFIHASTGKWELVTYNRFWFRGYVEPFVSLSPGEPAVEPHMEYNYNAFIVRGSYSQAEFEYHIQNSSKQIAAWFNSFILAIGPFFILSALVFFFSRHTVGYDRWFCLAAIAPMGLIFFWYNIRDLRFWPYIPIFIFINLSVLDYSKRLALNRLYRVSVFFTIGALFFSYMPLIQGPPTNAVLLNHRLLGEWMRTNIPEVRGQLIADRKPYVTYYARGRYFRYNNIQSYDELVIKLKNHHIQYLIVDDYYTRTKNPKIYDLVQRKDTDDLRFIYGIADSAYGDVLLFKLKPEQN